MMGSDTRAMGRFVDVVRGLLAFHKVLGAVSYLPSVAFSDVPSVTQFIEVGHIALFHLGMVAFLLLVCLMEHFLDCDVLNLICRWVACWISTAILSVCKTKTTSVPFPISPLKGIPQL